jgi:hypothetical protein
MLRCREVAHLFATDEVERAGWLRRVELRLHLRMCRYCRLYAQQIRKLGEMARRVWGKGSSDPEVLARLEQKILHRIGDNPSGGGAG